MRSKTIWFRVLLFIVFMPTNVHGEWAQITSKRYQHLASGNSILVANSEEAFLRLDFQGNVIEQISQPKATAEVDFSKRQTDEKILDDFRFRDIDQTSERARTLLENERTLADRRNYSARPLSNRVPRKPAFDMAMDGDRLWTATSDGLFEWIYNHPRQILQGPFQGHLSLASANGRVLLSVGPHVILFNRTKDDRRDFYLKSDAIRVTLSASGRQAAWLSGNVIVWWHESRDGEGQSSLEFVSVSDIAFCGETLLILQDRQVLIVTEDGASKSNPLPQPAHQIVCMNEVGAPWVLLGKDLLFSTDGGSQWQDLPLPPFTRIRDMAATASGALILSSEGLHYCPWRAWSTSLPSTFTSRQPQKPGKTRLSWLEGHLPRVTVHGQYRQSLGKEDFRTLLFATFPLDQPSPFKVAVSQNQGDDHIPMPSVDEPSVTLVAERTGRELPCLHRTRRKITETFLVEPERARSYIRRSAHAAWLPELRVMVDRRFGRSESLDYVVSPVALSSPLGVDTVNDVRYEARATWDLARLIFSPEELAAQSQAIRMSEQRRDIEFNVNRLFFERQRLQQERGSNTTQGARRSLRLQEISAELDALSNNTFSECLARLEKGTE